MKPNHVRRVSEQAFNQLVEAVEGGKSHLIYSLVLLMKEVEHDRVLR